MHWIQTAAVAPAQFMYTRTRARRSYITRYARIIGFSGSAGLSSPSGNGATNTRTGRPEPPCSTTFPRMIPVQHWSNRALKSYVLALMGAIRQYQSHTEPVKTQHCAGYIVFQLFPEMKQLKTKRIRQTLRAKANVRKQSENHECAEMLRVVNTRKYYILKVYCNRGTFHACT